MSLCECDIEGDEWWWHKDGPPKPFNLNRRKRCINCKTLIDIGSECQEFDKYKIDEDGNDQHMAPFFLCETCNDITLAIEELNGCYTLGGISLKQQIRNANEDQ